MNDTWLITGSSVGLGRSIVEAALAAGHNVVATARDPASLDDLASRFPDRLLAQRLDVTDEVRAQEVVAAAVERFGLIDVLVNNAGFSGVGSIEDMPLDLIEAQFDTNFMGAVHTERT
jgi:NAD(P)-dependent dehydrogenase (short-subunit alcohol dehydrogenase family)